MTKEPTTESLDDVRIVRNALADAGLVPLISDEDWQAAALNIDKMKGRVATDPLADVCAYVGKTFGVTNWQELAAALRTELANIGWQVGPIETPSAPEPAPAHPLTYEQVIENCARLLVGLGNTYLARELREGNWASLAARTFIAEYRRQTSALTTPDVVTGDMVGRAIGQPTASPILSWSTARKTGAIHFQTLAYNLNIELLGGRS